MKLSTLEDSKNYTCSVVALPYLQDVKGLDNLKAVTIFGNQCLVGKDSKIGETYLFFPAESQLSHQFLSYNNLYRHSELNRDPEKKGFFEDNRRVKAVKFKGVISSGFAIPVSSLEYISDDIDLRIGQEFTNIDGIEVCRKYIKRTNGKGGRNSTPRQKIIDGIVDGKFAPEHFDTEHLLKNTHKLSLKDTISITYKLHGTSARYFHTQVKRTLPLKDRIARFFGVKVQEEYYDYISGSRKVIKSVNFEELPGKRHFYTEDLWSRVGKEFFNGKLNHGESVYCEIIGKDYTGAAIQHGYTYKFESPTVFVYRISNINSQGIEVDLSYQHMKERAKQLGLYICPEYFYGTLEEFLSTMWRGSGEGQGIDKDLEHIFYDLLLEKPSVLDDSVVEEGFCLRVDKYPRPEIYKIKSRKFLEHETKLKDKEIKDVEDEQTV